MALAACVLGWRDVAWRVAAPGLDSWQAALALGYQHHLQWGPQMLFTFGPFGFSEDVLPYFRSTAAIGLVFVFALSWATAAMVVAALRPSWRLLPAGIAAWGTIALAGNVLEASQLATATALGLALVCLRAGDRRWRTAALTGLAALSGYEMLVEISPGLVCTGILAVTIAAVLARRDGPGAVMPALGAYFGLPLACLVAAGQSLANLPGYLHGSLEVALGYSSAMGTSTGRVAEDWYGALEVVMLAGAAWVALRRRPWPERAAVWTMLAGWGWGAFKEGYVRHDIHDVTFLALVMLAIALFTLPRRWAPVQALALGLSALMVALADGGAPPSMGSPVQNASALGTEISNLAVSSQWDRAQSIGRFQERILGGVLPPALLASLAGRTMAAEPWEDSLAFTYPQLHWDPEPVAQAYSAYTPYLDNLDTKFLLSARAPQRLLYQPVSVDGRNPYWTPPAATEAMLCRYRQVGTVPPAPHRRANPPLPVLGDSAWQVLALGPDRCGPARLVSSVTTHFGEPVSVPAPSGPGEMVMARISFGAPLLSELEGLVLRPPAAYLDGWAGRPLTKVRYRLVPATAPEPHVLTTPASLGYSLAYTPPQIHSFRLTGGGWSNGSGSVKVEFLQVPVGR